MIDIVHIEAAVNCVMYSRVLTRTAIGGVTFQYLVHTTKQNA